jgi:hypothetical protein
MLTKKQLSNCSDPAQLQQLLDETQAERKKLLAEYHALEPGIHKNYEYIEAVKQRQHQLREEAGALDWPYLLEEGNAAHKAFDDATHKIGLFHSGYLPGTNQRSVKVMLTKGSEESYEKTVAALRELLPYIKPLPGTDDRGLKDEYAGYKYIGVFDHGLSEYASYSIRIREETDEYLIVQARYSTRETLKKFNSLEDLIKCVQDRFWYNEKGKD